MKIVYTQADTLRIDSLSIVPGSLSIQDVPDSFFRLDAIEARLTWLQKNRPDSVWVRYRVFPRKLNAAVQEYDFDSVRNNFLRPFVFKTTNANSIFNFGNMDYSGSFGREISFGNAQDAIINSNFNLQISGMLADSIQLTAALSDQNLPIQPDGNTAQLNEVDRIWIQLKKKNWQLDLGDIDLRRNSQYFLNFYKRMQGVAFESSNKIGKKINNHYLLSGAIAKGKFTTNQFQGLEGNQGPYRLQGANNEFFFILLAGTEKVFIDGEQVQRGEDQDYIINYNTAEITFTPKRLITKDKRIRIEFEYADRNYLNAQVYLEDEISIKDKLKVKLGVFSNADSKNSPLNQTIDPLQRLFMAGIGDNVANAYYPNVTTDTLTAGKILYKRKDTTYNSITQTIYIYSTNPDSARYNPTFAELGQGKGDYIPLFNGANGKVYVWVQPVNGLKQGRFEPVQYIVAPRKQQMASITTEYYAGKQHLIKTDLALSKNDVNTFSQKDKNNDIGWAGKVSWTGKFQKADAPVQKSYFEVNAAYEALDKNFRTMERLRTPEFNRDWNLPFNTNFSAEQLGALSLSYKNNNGNFVQASVNNYFRGTQYKGYRQSLQSLHNFKGWLIATQLSYTTTDDTAQKGIFLRPSADISRVFPKLKNYRIGAGYQSEENKLNDKKPDSLNGLSQAFQSWKVYLLSAQEKPNKWGLTYTARTNHLPVQKNLLLSDKSSDISFNTSIEKNPNRRFYLTATWRNLDVKLPQRVTYKSESTLLGRMEYRFTEWKGLLNGRVVYESGSGQEQRRDLAYFEVPAGQGEYYWIDYNNNGAQELNEFELALYPDQKKFIRIFVPTNEFIKAAFTTFDYQVALNPASKIKSGKVKGIKKVIARTWLQSRYQVAKKETGSGASLLNPFQTSAGDAALITLGSTFINSFSFNRQNPKWGFDVNQVNNSSKSLLTYGYETRELKTVQLKTRWAINRKLLLEADGKTADNRLTTPGFNNRNYQIDQQEAGARCIYTRGSGFRLQGGYAFSTKKNQPQYGGEQAVSNAINSEVKYNALQSVSLSAKFTYNNIRFTGAPNTTIAYTMMDGLLPGKNYLWNADLTKVLGNNLELTFRYEGRKAAESRTVHTGTATLRAAFY
jgi:hypothetical protein